MNAKKHVWERLVVYFAAIIFAFPIVATITGSFASAFEISAKASKQIVLIPRCFSLNQYLQVFFSSDRYLRSFLFSFFVALTIASSSSLIAFFSAYVFAKIQFRWRENIFFLYLLMMLMPYQVTLVPNFLIVRQLGLYNSVWGLILPGIFAPFSVVLLRQFIRQIDTEICEVFRMDCNSSIRLMYSIIFPCCRPGFCVVFVLSFSESWNMIEQPLTLISDPLLMPLSILLSQAGWISQNTIYAASVVAMLPMIVLFLYFNDQLIIGLESVK